MSVCLYMFVITVVVLFCVPKQKKEGLIKSWVKTVKICKVNYIKDSFTTIKVLYTVYENIQIYPLLKKTLSLDESTVNYVYT